MASLRPLGNGLESHSQWNPDNSALFVYEIDLRLSLQRKQKLRQGQRQAYCVCAASWIIHVLEVGVARTIKVFQQRNRFVNLFTQVSVCVWANNSKVSVKSFSTLSTIPHSQPLGSVVKIRLHNLTHKFDTKKKMNFPQMHKTFVLTINADRRLSNMENAEDLL